MNGVTGAANAGGSKESSSRAGRERRRPKHDPDVDHKRGGEDGGGSTDSTPSTSDDLEMESLGSEDGLQDDEETGLNQMERRKRRTKKRRNTMLDSRVAGETKMSKAEQTLADRSVLRRSVVNGILIGLW